MVVVSPAIQRSSRAKAAEVRQVPSSEVILFLGERKVIWLCRIDEDLVYKQVTSAQDEVTSSACIYDGIWLHVQYLFCFEYICEKHDSMLYR